MKKNLIIIIAAILIAGVIINSCKSTIQPIPVPAQPTPTTCLCAPCPTKTAVPTSYGELVDNCDAGINTNAIGGYWFTINDCGDGGYSYVWPPASSMEGTFIMDAPGYGGCGNAAHMTGTVNGFNGMAGYQNGFTGFVQADMSMSSPLIIN